MESKISIFSPKHMFGKYETNLGNRLGLLGLFLAKKCCGLDCVAKKGIEELSLDVLSNVHTMPA